MPHQAHADRQYASINYFCPYLENKKIKKIKILQYFSDLSHRKVSNTKVFQTGMFQHVMTAYIFVGYIYPLCLLQRLKKVCGDVLMDVWGTGAQVPPPCEERPGLPHARHGRFQLVPTALPQGMAGSCTQNGGTSETRNGKMVHSRESEEKLVNTERRRAGGAPAGTPLQPVESPHWDLLIM